MVDKLCRMDGLNLRSTLGTEDSVTYILYVWTDLIARFKISFFCTVLQNSVAGLDIRPILGTGDSMTYILYVRTDLIARLTITYVCVLINLLTAKTCDSTWAKPMEWVWIINNIKSLDSIFFVLPMRLSWGVLKWFEIIYTLRRN